MSDILDKAEALIEQGYDLIKGPALEVENIDDYVMPRVYASIQENLKNKVNHLISDNFVVRYLGIRHSTLDTQGGSEKLADVVNEYCSAFQVKGQLSTFIKVDLYFDGSSDLEPMSLYVGYVAFTHQASRVIDQLIKSKIKSPFFEEGGVPA